MQKDICIFFFFTWSKSCLNLCSWASSCLLWSSSMRIRASSLPLCCLSNLASATISASRLAAASSSDRGWLLSLELWAWHNRSYSAWRFLAKQTHFQSHKNDFKDFNKKCLKIVKGSNFTTYYIEVVKNTNYAK